MKPWIWDTPYEIPGGNNTDNYPLVKQWPDPVSKPIQIPDNECDCNNDISIDFPTICGILERLFRFIPSISPFPVPLMCWVIIFIAEILGCQNIP